jgi:hypothetical protein
MMSGKRILVLCGRVAVAIFALGYPPGREFSTMRPPNAHETFYQYIAFEFDAPALCAKLSPSTVLPGGFFIAASYARSDCYAKLARHYDRPSLCWSGRRLGSFSLLSEQTSRLSCFWDVWHRAPDPSLSTYMPGREDLVAIFAEMGYQPEELYREGVTPPLLSLRDAYARLAQQPDLISRIARVTAVAASDRSVGPPRRPLPWAARARPTPGTASSRSPPVQAARPPAPTGTDSTSSPPMSAATSHGVCGFPPTSSIPAPRVNPAVRAFSSATAVFSRSPPTPADPRRVVSFQNARMTGRVR